jgi:subfamily B ATP-binding cassette protein MsbA
MEELSEETTRNLKEEKDDEKINSKNVLLRRESTLENADFESEEEKLKKSNTNYSKSQLIVKSMKVSLLNWKYILYTRLTSIFFDILDMYIPVQRGLIIDCITDKSKNHLLYQNFITVVKFIIIKLIFELLFQYIQRYFINDSLYDYKDILLEDMAKKDIEFYDLYKTGELLEKLRNAERVYDKNMVFQILKDLQHTIKIIYLSFFLMNTNLKLSLISLILVLVQKFAEYFSKKASGSFDVNQFTKLDEKYNNYLTDFVFNIRLIKSFATEKFELNRIKKTKRKMYKVFDNPLMSIYEAVYAFSKIGDYILLYYTGNLVISGKMSFGQYTIFENYFSKFQDEFESLYKSFEKYNEFLVDWKSFFELYDYKQKITSLKNYIPEKIDGKINFEQVSFSYPLSEEVKILDNLSFLVEPGKILALVGYSGSGKSTISNLIQRFYDPNEGSIFIDNINIKDYNLDWLHQNIGFVSQEPILCNGTIEYNITYGVKEYTKDKLEEICELAHVNKFLKDKRLFPEGLNTKVGERGTKVSGGQKQRIAIARAIMKDVKILIFDEATSALDAESENEVQLALDNIIKTKKITTIIIAHRLSTIRNADKILFLNKGKIVESGTHEELLNLNGEYKKLVSKQL